MGETYYSWLIWGSSFGEIVIGDGELKCKWSAQLPFTYMTPVYGTFDNAVLGAIKASTAEDDSYDIYIVCKVVSNEDRSEFDDDWYVYTEPSPSFVITRGRILSFGGQSIDVLQNYFFGRTE